MSYAKNQVVTMSIEDIGNEGEGIGFLAEDKEGTGARGFAVFVKDALPGDYAQVKLIKIKKNYAYGRLEKVITPSPFRVEPKCAISRQCGGCQIQAMSYEKQLSFKEDKVKNNLVRIGGFDREFIESVSEPIVGMDNPYRYRNKAQFPIGVDKDGNIIAGFYAGRTHSIIPCTDCILGVEENKVILDTIVSFMKEYGVSAYEEESGKGLVRHVLIRKGFSTNQLMVCVVINGKKIPHEEELVKRLADIENMTSVSVSVNEDNTNVIMGKDIRLLWGSPVIEDTIKDVRFKISPLSFYQVNPVQTEKLYSLALEYAGLTGKETVWDLYCGIGTISLFLAKAAAKVYGVEIVPQAIEDAKENAKANGINNAVFYVGKAEEVLPREYKEHGVYADVIVVDPPRKGCDGVCLETMLKMQPKKIVYVSCDSATLARDLKILCEGGYELKKVRPVDQFGHTTHVETVCLLSKLHEAKHHVDVTLEMDELDITSAESKATYEEIKAYVAEHNEGMKVSSLYIAQVKKKCGLELGENFNLPKSENAKQP